MPSFEENYVEVLSLAWRGSLEFAPLIDCCAQMDARKLSHLSAVLYQTWLARSSSPYAYAAYFNLGVTLSNLDDLAGAEVAYRKSIELHGSFAQPRLNLGSLFERQKKLDKAIEEWHWVATNLSPQSAESKAFVLMALNHMGRVQEGRKQFQEALDWLTQSLKADPKQADVLHHWIHLRQKQCIWPVYTPMPGISMEDMDKATSALAMISVSDDPAQQLDAARRFVAKKVISEVPKLANAKGYGHSKLRIAYVSSDFSLHPVSMLTAEMYELHDRTHFEVYGYCWSPEDGSDLRARVIKAMDHFIRIDQMSDEAAARLMREHEIDILIDLQGQTAGARANLLAYRPAPIQITYLGLPATTGLPSIDYVIADKFLIPEELAHLYSEKPLYMPDIYQVSDRKRPVGNTPSRASLGLPEGAFVFCSLNNTYKYTPEMFDVWMRILKRAPKSVLLLLADNPWAETNLRREAEVRGIDKTRLHFAQRVLPHDYLARYGAVDLFLDTFPFNAGTTANDALWMGLPVVTYTGRSFASRMAGALLTAAGLPELITYNLQDYEEKAVALANDRVELERIKNHLAKQKAEGTLFDTPRFVKNLELQLKQLVTAL